VSQLKSNSSTNRVKKLGQSKFDRQKILSDFGWLALLILVTVAIATPYVSSERFFYFWDFANYPNQTSELVAIFRESKLQAIRVLLNSFSTEYNKLPCLPLIPFILIFGDSRLVYILSCVLVYLVPFSLVMGKIATKIIPIYPRTVFWSTAFLTILIPPIWIATLRGYPDVGGAVIIGLAILVYLKDTKLRHRWQIPLIGFLLASAILFRRYYAYSARAFIVAMALQGLLVFSTEVRNYPKRALQNLTRYGVLISLIAVSSLATIVIVEPKFLYNLLTTNYRSLYASYERSIIFTVQRYGLLYSWLIWFLTFLGLSAGTLTRVLVRSSVSFIAIFGSISLIQWGLFAKQQGIHYGTQFAFLVSLGVTAFIWTSWIILKRKVRLLILSAGLLFLISNLAIGLTHLGNFNGSFRSLFAASHPPLVRQDYDEFVRFIEYLREIAPNQEAIYIAASSGILNKNLVEEAEKQLYGKENRKLNVLNTPVVDSRDFYPLNNLLKSEYVVVTSPLQYSLPPQEHDVVTVVRDTFAKNWELAQDFEQLSEQLILDKNVIVNIYKRTHSTSLETAFNTLKIMQERIQAKPGKESNWVIVDRQRQSNIWYNKHGTINIQATFKIEAVSSLYFGSIPEFVEISGLVESSNCLGFEGFSLRLATLSKDGKIINTKESIYSSQDLDKLSLSISGKDADYLRLDLMGYQKSNDNGYCSIYIKDMAVSDSKARS
jgi:hypothetical protein